MIISDFFYIIDKSFLYKDLKNVLNELSETKDILHKIFEEYEKVQLITPDPKKIDKKYIFFDKKVIADKIINNNKFQYSYEIDINASNKLKDDKFHARNELTIEILHTVNNQKKTTIIGFNLYTYSKLKNLIIEFDVRHFNSNDSNDNFKSSLSFIVDQNNILKSVMIGNSFINIENNMKFDKSTFYDIRKKPSETFGSIKNIFLNNILSDDELLFLLYSGGFKNETVELINITHDNFNLNGYERNIDDNIFDSLLEKSSFLKKTNYFKSLKIS